jgi:hypothetical protein
MTQGGAQFDNAGGVTLGLIQGLIEVEGDPETSSG